MAVWWVMYMAIEQVAIVEDSELDQVFVDLDRIERIHKSLPEMIQKLQAFTIEDLSRLDANDLDFLEMMIVCVDDMS